MAIDPNIPLAATEGLQRQRSGPGATMRDFFEARKIDDARVQAEVEARRKAEEERLVGEAFSSNTRPDGSPDYDRIVNTLAGKNPDLAMRVQEIVAKGRKTAADAKATEIENAIKGLDQGIKVLQAATDQSSYDAALPVIRSLDPGIADALGPTYDPNRVQSFLNIGFTAQQLYEQRRNALADWQKGDTDGAFLRYLKTAANDEEYQNFMEQGRQMGVPEAVLNAVPKTWSADAVRQVEAMSQTYKDQLTQENAEADDRRQAEQLAETQRHNRTTEGISGANLSLARQREARQAAAARAGGSGTGTDAVGRRQAEAWRANQLAALARAKRDGIENAVGDLTPMTPEMIREEEERIESSYRAMAGIPPPPDNPAFPKGVADYVRKLKGKYETYEEAAAELDTAMAELVADHPNMNESQVRDELAKAFGVRRKQTAAKRPKRTDVEVGKIAVLKDGRKIRIKAVDPQTGQITDYEPVP